MSRKNLINRLNIFENLEIVNVTPIVTVTSYPPKPERVANIILKVEKENFNNTCEDVLLEWNQRRKPFSIYRTNKERVCVGPHRRTPTQSACRLPMKPSMVFMK